MKIYNIECNVRIIINTRSIISASIQVVESVRRLSYWRHLSVFSLSVKIGRENNSGEKETFLGRRPKDLPG